MYRPLNNLRSNITHRNFTKGFTPTVKFRIIAAAAIRRCASVLFNGISEMKNTFFPQKAAMRNSIRDRSRRLCGESELCNVSPKRHRYEKASLTAGFTRLQESGFVASLCSRFYRFVRYAGKRMNIAQSWTKPQHRKPLFCTGFTLVEMIVAMGVFTLSMLIIVGSLVSLNNASRKARTERIATDNLSAAIDSMARSMRMGTSFHCGCGGAGDPTFPTGTLDCPMDAFGGGGAQCIAFEGQSGTSNPNDQIVFRFFNGHLQRSTQGGALLPVNTYLDMTAPEIVVTNLKFYLRGSAASVDQPVITMNIRGKSGVQAKTTTDFNLQTTISPRTPNF